MSEQKHYIEMMINSLQKKIVILDELMKECEGQAEAVEAETADWTSFDGCISRKQILIDELRKLDEGFSDLYERVKNELYEYKATYKAEIMEMQGMIKQITDRSVQVQTIEERNRKMIEKGFRSTKRDIRASKASVKAATDYYKTMSNLNIVDPQFMDHKK